MLDFLTTDRGDLRSAGTPWRPPASDPRSARTDKPMECEVLIVGAGITGSLMAEHLAAQGRDVCVLDREPPGLGSTAASTAMLQWEIDTPLGELGAIYGIERAASIYRRSLKAVEGLAEVVGRLSLSCAFRARDTLYLAAGEVGPDELRAEHRLRSAVGLPGAFLSRGDLLAQFGLDRAGAILSPGSAEADPLQLAHELLLAARSRGAAILAGEAVDFEPRGGEVVVTLADGPPVMARHVVLATGYAMPDFVPQHLHSVVSSWAIKTKPQAECGLWPGNALIWEASRRYIYARTTADGGVVIGGEDAPDDDPRRRDALIPEKSAALQAKLSALWPRARTDIDVAWGGAFGTTEDGLPLIGRVPGMDRIYAAYGYGGNGITFSYMASRIVGEMIAGGDRPWFADFALDRAKP